MRGWVRGPVAGQHSHLRGAKEQSALSTPSGWSPLPHIEEQIHKSRSDLTEEGLPLKRIFLRQQGAGQKVQALKASRASTVQEPRKRRCLELGHPGGPAALPCPHTEGPLSTRAIQSPKANAGCSFQIPPRAGRTRRP